MKNSNVEIKLNASDERRAIAKFLTVFGDQYSLSDLIEKIETGEYIALLFADNPKSDSNGMELA
jgi:hypothetical protein